MCEEHDSFNRWNLWLKFQYQDHPEAAGTGGRAVRKGIIIYWGGAISQALSQGFYMCSLTIPTTTLHTIHVTRDETLQAQERKWRAACDCTGIQSRRFQKHVPEKAICRISTRVLSKKEKLIQNLGDNHGSRWLKWVEDTTFGRDGVKEFSSQDVGWPICVDVNVTKNDNRTMVGTEAVSPLLKYSWVVRRSWEQQKGTQMV